MGQIAAAPLATAPEPIPIGPIASFERMGLQAAHPVLIAPQRTAQLLLEGASKNWPWHGLRLHPLQLPQWVSLDGLRGTRIVRGAIEKFLLEKFLPLQGRHPLPRNGDPDARRGMGLTVRS
jgi:hypothetical protein